MEADFFSKVDWKYAIFGVRTLVETGNSFTGSSPLKATSIRTVALDNELKLLEEKIKFAQESILKGYNI